MQNQPIHVIGTLPGCWTHWVEELLAPLAQTLVHVDPLAYDNLDKTLAEHTNFNVLALIEHPSTGLVGLLNRGEDFDPEAWLDEWLVNARNLLSYVQRNPDGCLVVSADDAMFRPRRLARLLHSRWGARVNAPRQLNAYSDPDPLTQALALSFVERDVAVQEIVPELLGCCAVLPGFRTAMPSRMREVSVDGAAAAGRLAELAQTEQLLIKVERHRAEDCEKLQSDLRSTAEECARIRANVLESKAERERLSARTEAIEQALAEARAALEIETKERNALAASVAGASNREEAIRHDLEIACNNAASLRLQLEDERAVLAQSEIRRSELEQELAHASAYQGTLEQQLDHAEAQQIATGQELSMARAARERLEQDLEQAKGQRSVLEEALAEAEDRRAAAVRALSDATETRVALEQELVRAADQRRALEHQLASAYEMRRGLEHKVTSSQEVAQSASEQCSTLLKQLHQVQEELERAILEKRGAESALRTAEEALAQTQHQRESLQLDLSISRAQCASLEQALASANTQRTKLEQELAQGLQQKRNLEQEVRNAKVQGQTLEHELLNAGKQKGKLELELGNVSKKHRTLEQELAQASKQRIVLSKELAKAKEAIRLAEDERALLLKQVHQVQEDLEQAFSAKRAAEKSLRVAQTGAKAKNLERDLQQARDECELLTLQTLQVQQELERVHAEKARLTHAGNCRIGPSTLHDITIGEVLVVGERDTPPHREVSFVVRTVRAGERQIEQATVRLVEHWGRPGLAVFAEDGRPTLFETWRESGREDGRAYMLLVHGEESAASVYDTMGTLDWELAQSLVARLELALLDHIADLSSDWQALAQRLMASLREQRARLRYDNVSVAPMGVESGSGHYSLTLERVSFHGRTWRQLPIQWRPSGPAPALELGVDERNGPPLLAWPTDADGTPARTLLLPLGSEPESPEVRAPWDMLAGSDRTFVVELLNLMPILALHLQAATTEQDGSAYRVDLQAAATEAMVFGRTILHPTTLPPTKPMTPQEKPRSPLLQRVARRLGASLTAPTTKTTAFEATDNR